jgi:acyl carrier protein
MDLKNTLQGIFRIIFQDKELIINEEMTAHDVTNWTSLTHLLMIEEVEKTFNIKVSLKELIKLKKVGDLLHLIAQKINK